MGGEPGDLRRRRRREEKQEKEETHKLCSHL
jgi:hypothetical protein